MNNMTTIVIFNLILYKKFTLESLFCFFWNKRPNSPQLLCQTSWLRVKRCLFLLWCFPTPSWCFPTYWIKFTNIGKVRSLTYNSIYDHQDSKAPEELASDPSPGDHSDGMAQINSSPPIILSQSVARPTLLVSGWGPAAIVDGTVWENEKTWPC